jgi:hypothetical protein
MEIVYIPLPQEMILTPEEIQVQVEIETPKLSIQND